MNLQELGKTLNMDIQAAVDRFAGQESLYVKFLKRFSGDTTINDLKSALETRDWKNVERSAHTIKGVSANLGLKELYRFSDNIVQSVRKGEYDNIEKLYSELEECNTKIIAGIEELEA